MAEEREKKVQVKVKFCINDHPDILVEILKRLDGRSLGVVACVCRQWRSLTCHDWLWENICFRYVSPPPCDVRPVVVALGGYRRLYMVCLRPLLTRLSSSRLSLGGGGCGRVWTRDEVQLSLSLFSIDYYERLVLGSTVEDEASSSSSATPSSTSTSSLMFLCKAVNV
ncbi:F-box protein SNE-like [Macadamia integrifolia]|uniref:F-box protein SNE-like n=1 Tax=Macadamia integrifolia TaxID=60698 RepID=UPI001C4E7816|nr:F-box protein SNE-like [Macadamia integrifolia]